MCMAGGLVQSLLLNGPTTNPEGKGFGWGLSVSHMYWLLAVVVVVFLSPTLFFFEERSEMAHEVPTMGKQLSAVWDVMHNACLFSIMIWSMGSNVFAGATNRAGSTTIEGKVVQLSQLEVGLDNVTTYLTLCIGIYLFKRYLINYNWRWTQLWTTTLLALLNLMWLVPILCRSGMCRSPWFCISIDSSEQFVQGITQVMISMAVVELAPVGLEATTYELLISVANSFITLNVVVSTQLMSPFSLAKVDKANETTEDDTHMAQYTILISCINVVGALVFVWFFPSGRLQCHGWKAMGGHNKKIAIAATIFASVSLIYAFVCCIMGVLPSTSCLQFVGGDGC